MSEGRVINLNYRHALPSPLLYVGFVDYYGPLEMRLHSAHRHGHYQFVLVTEGRFLFVPETGREIWLGPGEVVIFPPGVLHNWHVDPDTICRTFMVFFDAPVSGPFVQLGRRLSEGNGIGHWRFSVPLAQAAPMLTALRSEYEQNKPLADSVVYGLTMALMTFAIRHLAPEADAEPAGGFPSPLEAALEFVEARYAAPITVRDIAREAGVSPSRLNQLFQEHIGTSPLRYLNNHRIDRAKILLLYSPFVIAEIATQSGFTSPQYFSRVFTKAAGVTPGAFRAGRFLNSSTDESDVLTQ